MIYHFNFPPHDAFPRMHFRQSPQRLANLFFFFFCSPECFSDSYQQVQWLVSSKTKNKLHFLQIKFFTSVFIITDDHNSNFAKRSPRSRETSFSICSPTYLPLQFSPLSRYVNNARVETTFVETSRRSSSLHVILLASFAERT